MHYATDPRGHSLSSTNEVAVAACNAGIESFNRNRADAMSHLDAAIAADDGFALPRLAKAWMLQSARGANHAESIQALMRAAEACLDATDDRDGDYLTALKLAFSGRGIESATILEALLDRHPTDLLAHRLVQLELFWTGRAQWMLDITERAAPILERRRPGIRHLFVMSGVLQRRGRALRPGRTRWARSDRDG